MKKILYFIPQDGIARDHLNGSALTKLLDGGSVGLVVSSSLSEKGLSFVPKDKVVGTYKPLKTKKDFLSHFFSVRIYALAYRKKSSTFAIKIKSYRNSSLYHRLLYYLYYIVTLPGIFFLLKKVIHAIFFSSYEEIKDVKKIIEEQKPELVIYPLILINHLGIELIRLSHIYNYKTLFVTNSWDNLSSKSVFITLPDYLGVFGPQALVDAVSIHNMPFDRVFQLGCARYAGYFPLSQKTVPPFGFKYVVFAGASLAIDEISLLKELDKIIEEKKYDIKIVYRPHPHRFERKCDDLFRPEEYLHTIIDPQIAEVYFREKQGNVHITHNQNYPDLDYYPSLLGHALFLISPLSSLILESALFNTPSLILAHDDKVHDLPPSLIKQFQHFEGATNVPGWFFGNTKPQILTLFCKLFERLAYDDREHKTYKPALQEATRKYLCQDDRGYTERLEAAINFILANRE